MDMKLQMPIACAACLVASPLLESAVIANYTTTANDRFANDANFIASAYDLSGVALNSNSRWLTMISPNVFISANHFKPADSSSVTFYAGNDPLGASLTTSIGNTGQRIGASDLWLGTLSSPLPAAYGYYSFAGEAITNGNTGDGGPPANEDSFINSPYFEATGLIFGLSPTAYPVSQNMSVGRNKIDTWYDSVDVAGSIDLAIGAAQNESGDANYVDYETVVRGGDSGGPMFVEAGGVLKLVGINWFIDSGPPEVSGFTYVGNYADEINAYLNLYSVPEPSIFIGFAGMISLLYAAGNRRRRSCR